MRSVHRVFLVASILGFGPPLAAQESLRSKPARPQTYGTTAVSYVEVPAVGFSPMDSATSYSTGGFGLQRWSSNCTGPCFAAPLRLPAGARLVYLELDFLDTIATDTVQGTLFECDYASENCTNHPAAGAGPGDCLTSGYICSGIAFQSGESFESADLTPDGIIVDNFSHSYSLAAGGTSGADFTSIGGMIVGYVLQVSPPPGSATFADVPTNHPFFQFVEALAASGITAGCGGGNFCPNNPLTRGQMAVFLAKALGLPWP